MTSRPSAQDREAIALVACELIDQLDDERRRLSQPHSEPALRILPRLIGTRAHTLSDASRARRFSLATGIVTARLLDADPLPARCVAEGRVLALICEHLGTRPDADWMKPYLPLVPAIELVAEDLDPLRAGIVIDRWFSYPAGMHGFPYALLSD
jgi:hypothetical protein